MVSFCRGSGECGCVSKPGGGAVPGLFSGRRAFCYSRDMHTLLIALALYRLQPPWDVLAAYFLMPPED